ncbi:MAG: cytochrome c oxidase assembly protein [Candidatus Dormibacteraceae bacterium]
MIIAPDWYDNLPLVGVLVAAVLYELGGRQRLVLISRSGTRRVHSPVRRWRTAAFYAGLVSIVVALQPPMDGWADSMFWAHMIQHMLLLVVAAPFFVIAAPWMRLWSGFPLAFRRPVARAVVQSARAAPLRAAGRFVVSPPAAWVLFNAILIGWHVPFLYDRALQNQALHSLEHTSFLLFAVIFWAQLIDSSPFHARLDYAHRFFYMAASMFPSWLLALVMVFSGTPLYPAYAIRESSPSGLGVMADQQMGGAIMWMIGSIPFAIMGFCLIYKWVETSMDGTAQHGRRRRRVAVVSDDGPA